LEDYEPNSKKYKAEKSGVAQEKKVEKVISGTSKTKKKNEFLKLVGSLFNVEDFVSSLPAISQDTLIPIFRKALWEASSSIMKAIIFGESGEAPKSVASKISYSNFYEKAASRVEARTATLFRSFDDIVFESRTDAECVLAGMIDLIRTYGAVSIADFNELSGHTGNFTDNKYGWRSLNTAHVAHSQDGYIIRLPKAIPLN
jgi:hypothetical protein